MMIYPTPLPVEDAYPFSDETSASVIGAQTALLSAADKQQLLSTWQRFVLSGFKKLFFSGELYRFLIYHCQFSAHRNREQFWNYYFNSELARFQSFLDQFGADRRSAEQGHQGWLEGSAVDLKLAMCQAAERLYAPLNQVLQDLAYKHAEMIEAWHQFAQAAGLAEIALPSPYLVSENTRNLLAYAAAIALKQQRPLVGLQLMFPVPEEPLLHPAPVESQGQISHKE